MQKDIIKIERFIDKKNMKYHIIKVFFFIFAFLAFGLIDQNLFLLDNGLGLLEHINIWIFLATNLLIPYVIYKFFDILKKNIASYTYHELEISFDKNAKLTLVMILSKFFKAIGFCYFVGNTLQNAHIINQLPFDYWDSSSYIFSFIVSRIYKLYLFTYFIPTTLTYVFILIKSVSELLTIREQDMGEYPIKNYAQLNALCNFGLNILLTMLIPFIFLSGGIYWVHSRFDVTTIATIAFATICTLTFLSMYMLLIRNFYVSITKYKKRHMEQIDQELSKIHQYIIQSQFNEKSGELLEVYLKKENYLWKSKERINRISKFPLVFKAIITSISPFIPTLLKIIFSF